MDKRLWAPLLAGSLLLTGCSAGGGGETSSSNGQGVSNVSSTGSVSLAMRVDSAPVQGPGQATYRSPADLILDSTATLVVHVDQQGTQQDVVPATTVTRQGSSSQSVTITNIPFGTVVVVVDAFNQAGQEIATGSSSTVTISATPASANVTLAETGGINDLLVGSTGSPNLSLLALTPDLVAATGFTAPTLPGPPSVIQSSSLIFSDGGSSQLGPQAFGGNLLFWVASGDQIIPVSVNPSGQATALAAVTVDGTITAMNATANNDLTPILYVTTNALSSNLLAYPINTDGSLASPLASQTLTGGGVPQSLLVLFFPAMGQPVLSGNPFVYVVSNGATSNFTIMGLDPAGNFDPSSFSDTVDVTGNPFAISSAIGLGSDVCVLTSNATDNVQAFSQAGAFLNETTVTPPPTAGTIITPSGINTANTDSDNFLYVVNSGTTGNVIPITINSDGSLGTKLAVGSVGGGSVGTPVAVSSDFTGQAPFLFVGAGGAGQNVFELPVNLDGTLGPSNAAAAGSGITALAGI